MLNKELQEVFTGIRFEIIDLNQSSYFFVRKMNRMLHVFQNTTREFVLEELFALRYLENGIILHLTNLDDDKANFSFRKAQKLINKHNATTNQSHLQDLKNRIDTYRKNVNEIKTKHRNIRIAHLNSLDFPELDVFLNFEKSLKPLIQEANKTADFILGEKIAVSFKLGSFEGILNFRNAVKELKVEYSRNNDFS